MSGQWHFDADTYLAMVRAEIPSYDELQDRIAEATAGVETERILDLGSGTGVTIARVLTRHPNATAIGIDSSPDMLRYAEQAASRATFVEQRLEDPLPVGPFDLVVSAFAIHHLPGPAKADLFERVVGVLRPGGRFVMLDVVIPTAPVAIPVPIEEGVDLPDAAADQLRWLIDAGASASIIHEDGDLAILRADRD